MAEVAGKTGSLTCTNLTAGVKAWTLNYVGDALEITDYSDAGVRKYIVGNSGWTGTAEVNWEAANTIDVGDTISNIIFTIVSGTTYYTGDKAIVTAINVVSATDVVVTMSISFQGSEDLVLTAP